MLNALLFVACLIVPILWGLWRMERRRVAEETRRTVMASVMDTQNNLLNNIVCLHTFAESGKPLNPSDLKQIDCAIRETQARLIEIAEVELQETRDLGGIKVLPRPKIKLANERGPVF